MNKVSRRYRYVLPMAIGAGLLVPTLSLLPLGSLWLWQKGYLLYWALATAGFVGISYFVQQRLMQTFDTADSLTDAHTKTTTADPGWTPAEEQAWTDVLDIARRLDVRSLNSQDAVIALGAETVSAVAKRLHPEVPEPLWQFTVPEALAIIEQVSRRLRDFAVESIPLSDRLTVAQAMSLYEWRGAIGIAEKAYDVWRLVRLANPLAAATHEMRERLSKQMLQWGRDNVSQRLAKAYITEIGRAAIDLYGGRLRASPRQIGSGLSSDARANELDISSRGIEPLRILIAGQVGAGKSSLINALAGEIQAAVDVLPTTTGFVAYELRKSGFPAAQLIDSPGLSTRSDDSRSLTDKAINCDLVLWIVPADRADREVERKAIAALRGRFAMLPNRRAPPMLLILSHIDRLRPFNEWLPPYDLQAADRPKSTSIRSAVSEFSSELGFTEIDVVPVNLGSRPPYNVDVLWARMLSALPDAQRAQLVRQLRDATSDWNWRNIWAQATRAGRILGRSTKS